MRGVDAARETQQLYRPQDTLNFALRQCVLSRLGDDDVITRVGAPRS